MEEGEESHPGIFHEDMTVPEQLSNTVVFPGRGPVPVRGTVGTGQQRQEKSTSYILSALFII